MNEPEPDAKPAEPELHLIRFMGPEIYRISSAEWNLYRDEEDGRMNLWISVECDRAIKQFKDTEYTNTIPSWEINLIEEEITAEEGFEGVIPEGYDKRRGGWITTFYAGGNGGSDRNTIKILKRDGDRLLIRLTAEVIDPNFYDDSKPRTRLLVETWFTKSAQGSRSMS